jgi:hypothetical protein
LIIALQPALHVYIWSGLPDHRQIVGHQKQT